MKEYDVNFCRAENASLGRDFRQDPLIWAAGGVQV